MKTILTACFSFVFMVSMQAQHLNGAWRLVEEDGNPVATETIKLYSNSYYTYASYDNNTGRFIEAGGGTYFYEVFSYTENVEIDSNEPKHSGTKRSYKVILEEGTLTLTNLRTGKTRVWEKFDEATDYEMVTCWRIHEKRDEGDEYWRRIEYAPRKTVKMLTNNRYQVLALNSETGQFVGTSGGTWSKDTKSYTENIEFFSKNQDNVGRNLKFNRKMTDGLWHHTGTQSDGLLMMEKWMRYK